MPYNCLTLHAFILSPHHPMTASCWQAASVEHVIWTCYLQPPAASTVPSSVSLPTSRPLIGRTVPESLETLLGCRELVEPEACSCFNIAINLNGWTILQSMPLDLPLPTTEKPICQEKGKSHLGLVWPPFLPWDFSLFESFIYVVLPCCYLAAQSKIHELWEKEQFERLSKPGSIASVALSQDGCGCPFGATTLGFMWTNDQCWPWAMWISQLCWQVFYIKPGNCNKRRCDHATPFAIRNLIKLIPQCLHMDWLFVCFFVLGTFKQLAIL